MLRGKKVKTGDIWYNRRLFSYGRWILKVMISGLTRAGHGQSKSHVSVRNGNALWSKMGKYWCLWVTFETWTRDFRHMTSILPIKQELILTSGWPQSGDAFLLKMMAGAAVTRTEKSVRIGVRMARRSWCLLILSTREQNPYLHACAHHQNPFASALETCNLDLDWFPPTVMLPLGFFWTNMSTFLPATGAR